VAGIIAAQGYNGIGTVGVNLDATILPLRVFPIDGDGGASTSSISSAISYARSHGAVVINMSLGSPYYSSTLDIAVTGAVDDGLSVVCAAGNSGVQQVHYPAGYEEAIAVASITQSDAKSSFSNYGTWVDICAPGSGITSTYFNNVYASMSGTSMASPEVAGVAALIRADNPFFTESQVREALLNGADASVYDSNPGYAGKLGSGCADALGALEYSAGDTDSLIERNDSEPGDATKEDGGYRLRTD
jgi:thermitase